MKHFAKVGTLQTLPYLQIQLDLVPIPGAGILKKRPWDLVQQEATLQAGRQTQPARTLVEQQQQEQAYRSTPFLQAH